MEKEKVFGGEGKNLRCRKKIPSVQTKILLCRAAVAAAKYKRSRKRPLEAVFRLFYGKDAPFVCLKNGLAKKKDEKNAEKLWSFKIKHYLCTAFERERGQEVWVSG